MAPAVRFVLGLVVVLALFALGAVMVTTRTARNWFEGDVRQRAQVAVSGARLPLIANWAPNRADTVAAILTDLVGGSRILAAAACERDLTPLAETERLPSGFDCANIGRRLGVTDLTTFTTRVWTTTEELATGARIHVATIPLVDRGTALGFVVVVHDFDYVEGRLATTLALLASIFGVVGGAAALGALAMSRWSRGRFVSELRGILRGKSSRRAEFQPILRDVREMVDQIVSDPDASGGGERWTPERLRHTLTRHLLGEKVVLLANREPYIHERLPNGEIRALHPASGLVSALEPVMRACSGTWIAHGSGSADRATADRAGRLAVPPGDPSYTLRRVWLSPEEERGYYYGFANEGLWPLCHLAHTRPVFRATDWDHYRAVNRRFVDAVCEEVDGDDPIILIQDYHFALAPALIKERLPHATAIMFWHIPWPNAEGLGICPWREALLDGMLGADIVGFHTQSHCNNFIDSVDRFVEARIDRERHAVVRHGHSTAVRPYPISIEWPSRWSSQVPSVPECRAEIVRELGLAPDGFIAVGVDRLDYTKGIEERLLAVERFLERWPEYLGRFTFIQLAAPSRTVIERYRQLDESVAQIAGRINERFGNATYRPVILRRDHHEPVTVFRYLRAADLCYVSSLHDGMNLVAKEFVAARDDERGVLVLSQFAGAARELTDALVVNPYDLEEASEALVAAIRMSPTEQQVRMRAMREFVAEFNVYRWAGRMLSDASRRRRQERRTDRLTNPFASTVGS